MNGESRLSNKIYIYIYILISVRMKKKVFHFCNLRTQKENRRFFWDSHMKILHLQVTFYMYHELE